MKKLGLIKIAIVALVLTAVSCDNIFIPDPIDPRLPKYTESGNNVAGALVNDETWCAEVDWTWNLAGLEWINNPSVTIWPEKDSVVICFPGKTGDINANIEFHLKSSEVNCFDDLVKLHGLKIELDGEENSAYYICGSYSPEAFRYKGIGQFYPNNIQMNDSLTEAVFSGTFGFAVTDSAGKNTKISYGRFDYSLQKENDFILNTEQ